MLLEKLFAPKKLIKLKCEKCSPLIFWGQIAYNSARHKIVNVTVPNRFASYDLRIINISYPNSKHPPQP